jgi:hypothetical protein
MSLVRENVKAIICLGLNKKIIDVFGNVVDIMVEVDNMNDAVKMAQRLTEKESVYCHLLVQVLICSKIMKTGEINLKQAVRNL